jgi:hypothetical protein
VIEAGYADGATRARRPAVFPLRGPCAA